MSFFFLARLNVMSHRRYGDKSVLIQDEE